MEDKNEILEYLYFDLLKDNCSLILLSRIFRIFNLPNTAIYEWIYELTFFVTSLQYEYLSDQTSVWSKQLLEQDLDLDQIIKDRPKLN